MVVVTKLPETDSVENDFLNKEGYVSKVITESKPDYLEISKHLRAIPTDPSNETASGPSETRINGLNHCRSLLREALADRRPRLLIDCCDYFIAETTTANVLETYAFVSEMTHSLHQDNCQPSAPPADDHADGIPDWSLFAEHALADAKRKCDRVINQNACQVFQIANQVATLSYQDMFAIMKRDSLGISEELLYSAMWEWGRRHCQDGDLRHMKKTLRDLPTLVRYGLMKPKTFKKLKGAKELLGENNWRLVKFYLEEKSKGREHQKLPYRWSMPRSSPPKGLQKHSESGQKLERIGIQCLICWIAVFD